MVFSKHSKTLLSFYGGISIRLPATKIYDDLSNRQKMHSVVDLMYFGEIVLFSAKVNEVKVIIVANTGSSGRFLGAENVDLEGQAI